MAKKKDLFDQEAIQIPKDSYDQQFTDEISSTPLENLDLFNESVQPIQFTGNQFKSTSIYDEGIPYEEAIAPYGVQDRRANQQGAIASLANGLASRGLSIIPKAGAAFGYVAGSLLALGSEIADPNQDNFSKVYNNTIADFFEGLDDKLREEIPVYKSQAFQNGTLLQQMSSSKFWADDFFDGIAYAASAYVPAGIAGRIGKALEIAGTSNKFLQAMPVYATTIYNAVSEAGAEANDTNKQLRIQLKGQINPETGKEFTDEEIISKAGEAAAETFSANAALLLIPDYIQSKFFLGNPAKNATKFRKAVINGEKSIKDIDVFKSARKEALKGIISEGPFEEGLQTAIQNYESRSALGETDANFIQGIGREWVNNWSTVEGQKSMVLGALIGGPMGFMAGARDARQEKEQIKAVQDDWNNNVLPYLNQIDKQYIENIKSIYDKNGNIDLKKANRLFYQAINDKILFDEATVATINNDKIHADFNNKMAASRKVYQYLTNENFEDFDEAIEVMNRNVNKTSENDEDASPEIAETTINELKNIYEEVDNTISSIEDVRKSEDEINFQEVLKKALYYEAVKRSALKDINVTEESQTEQIDKLIEDSQKRTDHLMKKSTRNELFEQYKNEVQSGVALDEKINKLQELSESTDPNRSEIDKLLYEIYEHKNLVGEFATSNVFRGNIDERLRTGDFNMKDQHQFNMGMDALVTENLNAKIAQYQNNEISLTEVLRTLTDSDRGKYYINDQDLAKTQSLINDKEKEVTELQGEAEKASERLKENTPTYEDFDPSTGMIVPIDNPDFNPEQAKADQLIIDTANQEDEDLRSAKEEAGVIKQLADASNIKADEFKKENIDDILKRKIADSYALDDIASISSAFENNPEQYDRVEEIDHQIEKLNNLKNYFQTDREETLATPEFDGFIKMLDDTIDYLKTIQEAAINNRSNRAAADENYQKRVTTMKFHSLGFDIESETISNSAIYNAVVELVGEELFEEAKKDEYADAHAEKIILALKNKSKEERSGLQKILNEQYESEYNTVFNAIKSDLGKGITWKSINQLLELYKQNPNKLLEELLLQGYGKNKTPGKRAAIDKYILDKDIMNLIRNAENESDTGRSSLTKENLLTILSAHTNLESIQELNNRLNSEFNIKDEVIAEQAYQKELEENDSRIVPTNQQITSIRSILNWFKQKGKNHSLPFRSWAYQKGLAGTGKTTVVARWFIKMSGLSNNEIYATANNESATTTLTNSLGLEANKTAQNIDKTDIKNEHRLLIIDEIGAISSQRLKQLGEMVAEINKQRAKERIEPLRVLALGDPTQINAKGEFASPMNSRAFGLINVQEMPPLTIRYRSNVSAVVDMQDAYLNNPNEVSNLVAKSNNSVGEASTGTHIAFSESTIKEQVALNPGKSKAIIVTNESDKAKYSDTGAEVLTYVDAQGRTFNEVYTDISPSSFDNVEDYNRAMYTATSRATDYIMLFDHSGTFQNRTVDTITANQEKQEQQLNDNLEKYKERLDTEEAILFDKDEKRPNAPVHEEVITDDDIETPEEPTDDSPEDHQGDPEEVAKKKFKDTKLKNKDTENIHDLNHPTQSAINYNSRKQFKGNLITNGSKVLYIKTKDNDGSIVIRIVAEKPKNPGHYTEIGILGSEEVESVLGKTYKEISSIPVSNTLKPDGTLRITDGQSILMEGVVEEAIPLTYMYDRMKSYREGSGLINKLLSSFKQGFLKMKNELNGVKIQSTRITIPSIAESEELSKKGVAVKAGIPYMIFELTSKKGIPMTPQYIRMNPRKLDKNKDSALLKPLTDFYNSIVTIEKMGLGNLGDPEFNKILKEFKKDFTFNADKEVVRRDQNVVTIDTFANAKTNDGTPIYSEEAISVLRDNFDEISKLIDPVIKGFYGYDVTNVTVTLDEFNDRFSDTSQYKKADPDIYGEAYLDVSGDILYKYQPNKKGTSGLIAESIVDQQTGETRPVITASGHVRKFSQQEVLKGGKGFAQNSLNVIAVANAAVEGTGIRVKIPTARKTFVKGKSLLTDKLSNSGYIGFLRNAIEPTLRSDGTKKEKLKFIETDQDIADAENYILSNNILTQEELNEGRSRYISSPITSEILNKIVNPNPNAEFYLRTPLSKQKIDELGKDIEKNKDELEKLLSSSFDKLLPTRIQVKTKRTIQKSESKNISNNVNTDINKKTKERQEELNTVTSQVDNNQKPRLLSEFKEGDYIINKRNGRKYEFISQSKTLAKAELRDVSSNTLEYHDTDSKEFVLESKNKTPKNNTGLENQKETSKIVTKRRNRREEFVSRKNNVRGKKLDKTRTAKLGRKITTSEAETLIRKLIPAISKEDLRFITRSTMISLTDTESWGLYKNGVIYIEKNEDGTVYENVLRHEVFHKIFSEYLTNDEQLELIRAFRKEVPDSQGQTLVDFEEMIAEKFQEWRNGKFKPRRNVITRFFQWIAKRLGFINKNLDNLDKFFTKINEGYFDKQVASSIDITRNLMKLKEWFNSTSDFRIIKNELIMHNFAGYQEFGDDNGYPMTKNEIRSQVLLDLKNKQKELNAELGKLIDEEEIREVAEELGRYDNAIKYYNQLISFIYPNWNIKEEDFIEETINEEQLQSLFDPEKENVNLNEYTVESDSVNQEGKITKNVKDFLSDIQTEEGDWVDPRFAYVKLLQFLEGLQTGSERFLKQIDERLENEGNNKNSIAIITRFKKLLSVAADTQFGENAPEHLIGYDLPNNYKFLDENTFIYSETEDLSNVKTISEAISKGAKILNRANLGKNISTETFVDNAIKLINPELQKEVEDGVLLDGEYFDLVSTLKELYNKHLAINTLREMITNFNSQKEKQIRFAQIKTKYGRKTYAYITGKVINSNNAIKNKVKLALSQKLSSPKAIKNFKNNVYDNLYAKYKNDDLAFIRGFANALGLRQYTEVLPEDNLTVLKNDIVALFEDSSRLNKVGQEVYESNSNNDASEFEGKTIVTIESVLDSEANSMINNLTNVLSFGNDFIRATSIRDASGKKKYVWSPGNQASENIMNLARQGKTELYNGIGNFKNLELPKFMKTEFFKNNIFSKGINNIFSIIDHDGIRDENLNTSDEVITTYSREKFIDYIDRHLNSAFIANINNSRKNSIRYTQFFYTISNKPNAIGAEIRALNGGEIKDAVKQTLYQFSLKTTKQVSNGDRTRLINQNLLWESAKDVIKDDKKVFMDKGVHHLDITPKEAIEYGDAIANRMQEKLLELSKQVADRIVKEKINFDQKLNGIQKLESIVNKELFPNWDINDLALERKVENNKIVKTEVRGKVFKTTETWKDVQKRVGSKLDRNNPDHQRQYLVQAEDILPIVNAFIANDYVNSYQLTQLVSGDSGFFKNGLDLVKRLSGAFGPGLRGFVHDKFGMKQKFRVAVGQDLVKTREGSISPFLKSMGLTEQEIKELLPSFSEGGYEFTDAQGFITPERFEDIKNGFGKGYGLSNVLKPAHYEIDDNGVPRMLKYSSIVLTDELVNKHEGLRNLRDNMRNAKDENGNPYPIDEFVFKTANKVGTPSELVDSQKILEPGYEINSLSTMELDNSNYRLQLNPYHNIDANVANPTQLGYFLKILETNIKDAELVYSTLSKLIDSGHNNFRNKIERNGEFSPSKFRNLLLKQLEGVGNERVHEFMVALSNKGKFKMPWNFPTIVDKSVIQLGALISKETIKVKFSGGKLVLQSSYGIEHEVLKRELKFVTKEDGGYYGEVIIPKGMLSKEQEAEIQKALDEGKPIPDVFLHNDLLGFRIPSSELHSAVPLKVSGFYDSKGTNVIIAPKEIVPLHGSDYDVDSLFVIRREYKRDENNNLIGEPIGFKDGKIDWNMNTEGMTPKEIEMYHKNLITETFLKVIEDPKNRLRMMSPISMEALHKDVDRINKLRGTSNEKVVDLSNILDRQETHSSSFEGAAGTGIFANGIKVLAYSLNSSKDNSNPELVQRETAEGKEIPTQLIIDGKEYKKLSNDRSLWEMLDSLLNAAIDNVKEQILPALNLTGNTIKHYTALRGLGIPTEIVNDIFVQPFVSKYINYKTQNLSNTLKYISTILGDNIDVSDINITRELLEKHITENRSLDDVNRKNPTADDIEFLRFQYKIGLLFEQAESIGNDLKDLSTYLNIIKDMPVTKESIDKILEIRNKIWTKTKDGIKTNEFSFNLDNFFKSNPHIASADAVLLHLNDLLETRFFKHNPKVYKFIKDSLSGTKLQLDKKNNHKDKEMKRTEFIKYVVSGLKWDNKFEGYDKVEPYHYINKSGIANVLTNKAAFTAHMHDKLKALQKHKDLQDNLFLNNLGLKYNDFTEQYSIDFTAGNNLDYADMIDISDSFEELSNYTLTPIKKDGKIVDWEVNSNEFDKSDNQGFSTIQKDFVRYSVINHGLQFGTSNYSLVLPPNIYKSLYRQMEKTLTSLMNNPELLSKLEDHFLTEVAVNYTSSIQYFSLEPVNSGTKADPKYQGFEEGVYFDRKFEIKKDEQGEKVIEFPRLTYKQANGKYTAYYKIFESDNFAYYQRVGEQNFKVNYNLDQHILDNGYNIDEAFRPDILNVQVPDIYQSKIEYQSDEIKQGMTLSLTNFNDTSRINKRYVNVVSKLGNVLTLETIDVAPVEKTTSKIEDTVSGDKRNTTKKWARYSKNGYEVSTRGDKRFSALVAKFKPGTTINITGEDVDVSNMTIESVYQNIVKKSSKGRPPATDSILFLSDNQREKLSTNQMEDISYTKGYLPLWIEWTSQNRDLLNDLISKSTGKTLTDQFASTRVSQARALSEIIDANEKLLSGESLKRDDEDDLTDMMKCMS